MTCRQLAELLMQTPDMEAVIAVDSCGDEYRSVASATTANLFHAPGYPEWMEEYPRTNGVTRTVRLLEQ